MYEPSDFDYDHRNKKQFHKKVEEAVQSVETQNINNYFVTDKANKVTKIESVFYDLVESIYLLFTDTRIYPHCKLLAEPLESRTYVDFNLKPLEQEIKINDIDYTMAYAMFQVINEDKTRCLRFLVNKENNSTVLVICFENCVWNEEPALTLKSATPVKSIPFVLDLIRTPSVGYLLQEFLAFGQFHHTGNEQLVVSSFTH